MIDWNLIGNHRIVQLLTRKNQNKMKNLNKILGGKNVDFSSAKWLQWMWICKMSFVRAINKQKREQNALMKKKEEEISDKHWE